MMGVAVSYFIHESNNRQFVTGESEGIVWLREKILGYLSNGLVSAEEILWTCPVDNNNSICQEYPYDTCNDECSTDCIENRRENTEICKLGTCIDPSEGTCSANVPQLACQESGGNWFEKEPAQCTPGCCLIGGNANFITQNSCNVLIDRSGIEGEWREVENELECLLIADNQDEGACVLDELPGEGFNCEFVTKSECLGMDGQFYSNQLCTNPELGTICEKTEETTCVPDKDQVYYKDSCGNTANIYDYDKKNNDEYWSFVVSKNESCSLEGNQAECGNCDYLQGSVCGEWVEDSGDDEPLLGEYVCRDLSCIDEWGQERKNGESWCAFDSRIGPDSWPKGDNEKGKEKNDRRSTDLPGSRHYRQLCTDGEVRTDPCQDYRNEICVENRDEEIGFSSSACRLNTWQVCLNTNSDKDSLDRCEKNADCFLKEVRIADKFKFDICAPKYPGGLNLREEFGGEVGESICGLATQTCKVIRIKKLGGDDWINRECLENKFVEGMNNLCTSLGDCGGNVNIEGVYTDDGFSVKGGGKKKLSDSYISVLKTYADKDRWKDQKAEPMSDEELAALFGMTKAEWEASNQGLGTLGMISGGLGIALVYLAGTKAGVGILAKLGLAQLGAWHPPLLEAVGPELSATGGALAGALIGVAITAYLIDVLGIGAGLPQAVVYGLVAMGAYAGAWAGLELLGANLWGDFFALGPYVLFILIIIIIIFALFGIGDTDTWKVTYTCRPWQPPLGGDDCSKCGDGLPCSEYKCQSLGQTCEFVNEGTGEEECVNIAPNDATPPQISPNYDVIEEPFEYADVQNNGFKVVHNELECIPAYTLVQLGVSLNEYGQCKYDVDRNVGFEDMEFWFGGRSLFKEDHSMALLLPSLESLGVYGVDPDRRADFNMYMKCRDGSGNVNEADYNIQFCISPENDLTPPILSKFNPSSPAYANINATEKDVSFYTNEPAECRWDSSDISYDDMINEVNCINGINEGTLFGWACNTSLTITEDENDYYFRCEDKPWESEDRNANQQGTLYEITRTLNPLVIDKIRTDPEAVNGVIVSGTITAEVELIVEISGGAPGAVECWWGDEGKLIDKFRTNDDITHTYNFAYLTEGDYHREISCWDIADNRAESEIDFRVELDTQGPAITRVYDRNNKLNVITNENSECSYSHNSCSFIFGGENVFEMIGDGLRHTADFDETLNYYVKCKDDFNNVGQCLTIRAGY